VHGSIPLTTLIICANAIPGQIRGFPSQRSLHNAPIFRLLLKVAVNGTHQCDFLNFCGGLGPQLSPDESKQPFRGGALPKQAFKHRQCRTSATHASDARVRKLAILKAATCQEHISLIAVPGTLCCSLAPWHHCDVAGTGPCQMPSRILGRQPRVRLEGGTLAQPTESF
jgi:hypothetical protein